MRCAAITAISLSLAAPVQGNTWQQMSPSGSAPSARFHHTAAWCDAVDGMYTFGGYDSIVGMLNDLWLFDRQANSWQQISPSGSRPTARFSYAAAWSDTADGMYIFGGNIGGGSRLNDLWLFDRQGNTWQQISPSGSAPAQRENFPAVWCDAVDGMYIFGGYDGGNLNDLWLFDRQANSWQQISPSGSPPAGRHGHAAVWCHTVDGMYVFGGGSGYVNDLWLFDRQANSWQQISPSGSLPDARYNHVVAWSNRMDGMYVFGGRGWSGRLGDVWLFDRQGNAWQQITPSGSAPSVRERHGGALSESAGGMYFFGGYDGSSYLNELWMLQMPTSTTTTTEATTTTTVTATMTVTATTRTLTTSTSTATVTATTRTLTVVTATTRTLTSTATTTVTATTGTWTTSTATTTVTATTRTLTTSTAAEPETVVISQEKLDEMERQRKEEAAETIAAVEKAEAVSVHEGLQLLFGTGNSTNASNTTRGTVAEASVPTPTGTIVKMAAVSLKTLDAAGGVATVPSPEAGAALTVSSQNLRHATEMAEHAGLTAEGPIVMTIMALSEEASSKLARDNVLAARRLASSLKSKAISISFWTSDGVRIPLSGLDPPLTIVVQVDDPNATCAFWDEEAAKWSNDGVTTLQGHEPNTITCNTTHLSVFGGVVVDVLLKNLVLALTCSTMGGLITRDAFDRLLTLEWLSRPASILNLLFLLIVGVALAFACKIDSSSFNKIPQKEREQILMRTKDDKAQETQDHEQDQKAGVVSRAKRSLSRADASLLSHCISLVLSHRSGVCRRSIHALRPSNARRGSQRKSHIPLSGLAYLANRMRKTKARAMPEVDHGSAAAKYFLTGSLTVRMGILALAGHPLLLLCRFSVFQSRAMGLMLLTMAIVSGGALAAVFFASSAQPADADPACSPDPFTLAAIIQAATVGLVTGFVGEFVIKMLARLQQKTVLERTEWTNDLKKKQWFKWRIRSILFCVVAFFYVGCCQLYIFLFIANVSENDAAQWWESVALGLAQDFILKPLVLGFILASVASLMLWRNRALLRHIENEWKVELEETPDQVELNATPVVPVVLPTDWKERGDDVDAQEAQQDIEESVLGESCVVELPMDKMVELLELKIENVEDIDCDMEDAVQQSPPQTTQQPAKKKTKKYAKKKARRPTQELQEAEKVHQEGPKEGAGGSRFAKGARKARNEGAHVDAAKGRWQVLYLKAPSARLGDRGVPSRERQPEANIGGLLPELPIWPSSE